MKAFKRVRQFIQDRGLKTKLLMIFFVFLLIPLVCYAIYASARIGSVLESQSIAAAQKTFQESYAAVVSQVEKVNHVIELLTHDQLIYQMSSTDPQDYPYIRQLEDARSLCVTFEHLKSLSGVSRISLYVKNDYLYANDHQDVFPLLNHTADSWYQRLFSEPAEKWFTPKDYADQPAEERAWFSCMRMLYDPTASLHPLSVLRVDLDAALLEEAISQATTTPNGMLLLLSNGRVASFSGRNPDRTITEAAAMALRETPQNEWLTIQLDGGDCFVYSAMLPSCGWTLTTVLPHSDIFQASRELRNELLLAMLLLAFGAYAASYFVSNGLLRRISQLAHAMKEVENGRVNVQFPSNSKDEIGRLIQHFNRMVGRLQSLMEEKIAYGLQIKNLELKALQAQINPHFLYNSLDTINCLAIQKDVPEITELVAALARFYKLSLSRGRERIPLKDEFTHAQMYLKIQNLRFENRIHAQWELQEDIQDCLILKIVLQPIIENAVIHGIFEKASGEGALFIKAWQEDNDIFISVRDDGVGMAREQLEMNFSSQYDEMDNPPGGYGIRNIASRLQLAYGSQYGLSCKSEQGVGTTVTIHIPMEEEGGR
ncbi:MAG: sensor histidine kinase [Eubacteriales bacterium]|nr:sensor histidine kinase [Eubacteriales bacterium]